MAENSKIQWTTHTFNPWRGCTKISAGCANCYADRQSKRNPKTLGVFGPNGTRVVASEAKWSEPAKWEQEAQQGFINAKMTGDPVPDRPRVFCASIADVFESWTGPMRNSKDQALYEVAGDWVGRDKPPPGQAGRLLRMGDIRNRLFDVIDESPNLDWLLLTKRPENIAKMMPAYSYHACATGDCPHDTTKDCASSLEQQFRENVWLGTTVEDRKAKARIDVLRECPAAVRFLSCEPLLEDLGELDLTGIHWVIVGGESGGCEKVRPFRLEAARSIVEQCRAAGVSCFVKQLGSDPAGEWGQEAQPGGSGEGDGVHWLTDKKGGDIAEFPRDLQVREFPKAVLA